MTQLSSLEVSVDVRTSSPHAAQFCDHVDGKHTTVKVQGEMLRQNEWCFTCIGLFHARSSTLEKNVESCVDTAES